MTGTSIDAIDVAAVEVVGTGLAFTTRLLTAHSAALGGLQGELRRLANQEPVTAQQIAVWSQAFSLLHIQALFHLAGKVNRLPDLIAVHGQTVFHAPPLSWQLFLPAPVAAALHAPVVFDLRQADLVEGGQGAPITPLADYLLFRAADEARAIVNLGGFCNFTHLPAANVNPQVDIQKISGGDLCACNHLLNQIARERLHAEFDQDGQAAARGQSDPVSQQALEKLLRAQAAQHRSLGTGDELAGWLAEQSRLSGESVARTACEALGTVIAAATQNAQRVILAGGGARNKTLASAIARNTGAPVVASDALGIPGAYREAIAMAVLGALCQDGIPITLPQITGAKAATRAGSWVYP